MHFLKSVKKQLDVLFADSLVLGQHIADRLMTLHSLLGHHFDTVHGPSMKLLHQIEVFVLLHLLFEQANMIGDFRLTEHF